MISFFEAANTLEYLCEQIDKGIEIDEELRNTFTEYKEDLEKQVDRRISYIKYCQSQINTANEMQMKWNERKLRFQEIMEKVKIDTVLTMKANPGVPYRGSLGKLAIYKNSQPTLKIEKDAYLGNYYHSRWVEELDRGRLINELKEGKEVGGVTLEYGDHMRILIS